VGGVHQALHVRIGKPSHHAPEVDVGDFRPSDGKGTVETVRIIVRSKVMVCCPGVRFLPAVAGNFRRAKPPVKRDQSMSWSPETLNPGFRAQPGVEASLL
jgi:hypothetical protein